MPLPLNRRLAGATFALTVLAPVLAHAQSPAAPSPLVEVAPETVVPLVRIPVDALVGLDVTDGSNNRIGDIDGVFGPSRTEATALAIDFDSSVVDDDLDRLVPISDLTLDGLNIVVKLDGTAIVALPKAPE